jgi:hypothetical protein
VFALAGAGVVEAVLGAAYGEDVGREVGRVVVVLSPWMVASVGVFVAFPLAFVAEKTRALPWIGIAALALQVPLAWLGAELFELDGLALAMAATTFLVLAALLRELGALGSAARGLAGAAALVALVAVVAFLPLSLVLASGLAAIVGLAVYAALLAVLRPRGLRSAWGYLRDLR